DRVRSDAMIDVLRGERLGERNDSALCRGIRRLFRTDHAEVRCEIDDGAPAGLYQMRDAVAAAQKRMQEIERDRAMPYLQFHFVYRHVFLQGSTGTVHQHIQFPELINARRNSVPDA